MTKEVLIKCICGHEEIYSIDAEGVKCKYCRKPILPRNHIEAKEVSLPERAKCISLINSLISKNPDEAQLVMSLGLFYLIGGGYSLATLQFKKVIELDPFNSDAYFYLSIALLNGEKPFVQTRSTINEIIENISMAYNIEPKGIYYYFHALVSFDYYARKYMNVPPSYRELLSSAFSLGVDKVETQELLNMLKIDKQFEF